MLRNSGNKNMEVLDELQCKSLCDKKYWPTWNNNPLHLPVDLFFNSPSSGKILVKKKHMFLQKSLIIKIPNLWLQYNFTGRPIGLGTLTLFDQVGFIGATAVNAVPSKRNALLKLSWSPRFFMFTVPNSAARTMEKGVAGIQPRAKRLLKQRILMLRLCVTGISVGSCQHLGTVYSSICYWNDFQWEHLEYKDAKLLK